MLVVVHQNPSKLFVLVTGDDRHNHAENGRTGPESMMLHKITSCVGMSYLKLTLTYLYPLPLS
jgi:hypothetical protein